MITYSLIVLDAHCDEAFDVSVVRRKRRLLEDSKKIVLCFVVVVATGFWFCMAFLLIPPLSFLVSKLPSL